MDSRRLEGEGLFRKLFEHSPYGMELYASDGVLMDANKACLDIFGVHDVSAVRGFRLFDDPNLGERHKRDLLAGKPVKQELSFDFDKVKKQGLYPTSKHGSVYLDMTIVPIVSAEQTVQGFLVYVRDISVRKRAEALLQERKKFAEEVIENSAVATFVLDPDHTVVLWNKACEELTGVRASEMIGTDDHWKPFYDKQRPTLADIVLDGTFEHVQAFYGKSSRSVLVRDGIRAEGWYADLNGKDRYIVFDAAPIYDSGGRLLVAIETLHDITELKLTGEELERKTNELKRSNEELEHFAHVASHDLKAPLLSIGGFAEIVQSTYADRIDEKGRTYLSRIVAGTARMERLINDLLAYATVTTQARPFGPVDCKAVLAAVLSNLSSGIEETGASITVDELPTVAGDETQLVRLFQNLIGNAINYRGDGPPRIRISAEKFPAAGARDADADSPGPTSQVAARAPQPAVPAGWLFSVSDNGIGIDSRYYERIFLLFQRLHTDETAYSGTGIGLAVCKKIVERHGGRIWVESGPGGSTFYFTIQDVERG